MRRGRTVQRASTESSTGVSLRDESVIIITRLVDETGWIICGALPTVGKACGCERRSETSWRARRMSVPRSNSSVIEDSPGIESERIVSTPLTPLRRSCSSGTVMSCSTSAAESPSASVCTWTEGCEYSGRTSTGAFRSSTTPATRSPAASATTSARKRSMLAMKPLIVPTLGRSRQAHDDRTTAYRSPFGPDAYVPKMACGRAGARTNAGGVRPARTRTRPQVNVKSHCDLLVRLRCCDDPPGPARRLELS